MKYKPTTESLPANSLLSVLNGGVAPQIGKRVGGDDCARKGAVCLNGKWTERVAPTKPLLRALQPWIETAGIHPPYEEGDASAFRDLEHRRVLTVAVHRHVLGYKVHMAVELDGLAFLVPAWDDFRKHPEAMRWMLDASGWPPSVSEARMMYFVMEHLRTLSTTITVVSSPKGWRVGVGTKVAECFHLPFAVAWAALKHAGAVE